MAHLIIVFKGIEDCKELSPETFTVTQQEWTKYTTKEYRKHTLQLPGYSRAISIQEVFCACQIQMYSNDAITYLTANKVMTFIRQFADSQRSQLDDMYY